MIDILDASALLTFFKEEPGYEKIKNILLTAHKQNTTVFIHQINYIEVVKKLFQILETEEAKKILATAVEPFLGISNYMTDEMATYATKLYLYPTISLGDSIGLAFTKVMEGRFWTADKALQPIAKKEKITCVIIR